MIRFLLSLIVLTAVVAATAQTDLKKLEMVNGTWQTIKTKATFSGDFAEYDAKGKVIGTGTMVDGKVNGTRTTYYPNGHPKTAKTVEMGVPNGDYREFYENEQLKIQGQIDHGKKTGLWTQYFENGVVNVTMYYTNDQNTGDYLEYDQGGNLLSQYYYGNGEKAYTPELVALLDKADELVRDHKYADAIPVYDRAIAADPSAALLYFSRGQCKLNSFDIAGSIPDFTKALELNPKLKEACFFRGMARINSIERKGGVKPTSAQTADACYDFHKAASMGYRNANVDDMIFLFCKPE